MLLGALEGADSVQALVGRVDEVLGRYFTLHREDPQFRGIWAAVQTDPALQALDVADSLRNAEILFKVARPFYRQVDDDQLMAACALSMQLALAAARFAIAIPEPIEPVRQGVLAHGQGRVLALEQG